MTTARRRRSPDLGSAFTFGGRIPGGLGLLLVAILFASVASWVTGARGWAELDPVALAQGGQLWRLVSWAFVQDHPITLLFGGFMLFSLGGQLAYVWSERRLVGTFLGLAVFATLVTTVVSFAVGRAYVHLGMWPVVNGIALMWALLYPDRQVNIWGVLPVTGKTIALLLVFGTVLFGLAGGGIAGLLAFTPHFAALALGFGLSRGLRLPTRRWKMQLREWKTEREFRKRSRHLKVVKKNGESDPPRWMN